MENHIKNCTCTKCKNKVNSNFIFKIRNRIYHKVCGFHEVLRMIKNV